MTNLKHYSHKVGMNFWHIEFATKVGYNDVDTVDNYIKNQAKHHAIA